MASDLMFGINTRFALGVTGLCLLTAIGFTLHLQKSKIFDLEKLEAFAASETSVPIKMILASDIETICVLGPYASAEFQLAAVDPVLTSQMRRSAVEEGNFRVAAFDTQSRVLRENDFPRWRGQIRIELDRFDNAFCQDSGTAIVKIVNHESFVSLRFVK